MRTITAADLKKRMSDESDLLLINTLDPAAFEKQHIPHSRNIPNSRDDFVSQVTELAERKDRPIVVYCASKDCTASVEAGAKLERAGFSNVLHFKGGLDEWMRVGYEVEAAEPAGTRS